VEVDDGHPAQAAHLNGETDVDDAVHGGRQDGDGEAQGAQLEGAVDLLWVDRDPPRHQRHLVEAVRPTGSLETAHLQRVALLAGEKPVLALVSGVNQLDVGRLASLAGAPVRKPDANAVRDATGYAIGGVPPTGFPTPIRTFIDRDLLQYDVVWAAAGTPRHVFAIAPQELAR